MSIKQVSIFKYISSILGVYILILLLTSSCNQFNRYGMERNVNYQMSDADKELGKAKVEVNTLYPIKFYKDSPLHLASNTGNIKIVNKICSSSDVNVNTREHRYWETPLHLAAEGGHIAVVRKLLSMPGIIVNMTNILDETPLDLAVEHNHQEIVTILLEAGAISGS